MRKGDDVGVLGGNAVQSKSPRMNILRPLLEVRKEDLQEVCRNEGVKWTEDQLYYNDPTKYIRKFLQENEELVPGIAGLIKTCRDSRRHLRDRGINCCQYEIL